MNDIEKLRHHLLRMATELDAGLVGTKELNALDAKALREAAATLSQPVMADGWREALLDLLNPLHGSLDKQLYDERSREVYDTPPDCEHHVIITEKMERDLNKAVLILEYKVAASPVMADRREGDAPIVSVLEMKTSAGPDYFSSIRCGDRQLEIHKHKIKGRAEFEVAEFQWLLNGGEKPNMIDWLDRTDDPAVPEAGVEGVVERVAKAICESQGRDWGKLFESSKDWWRTQARAAIAALQVEK